MARSTSFTLGEDQDEFVRAQVDSGAYANASAVVRAALAQFADEQQKEAALFEALDRGLLSGMAPHGTFSRIRKRYGWKR